VKKSQKKSHSIGNLGFLEIRQKKKWNSKGGTREDTCTNLLKLTIIVMIGKKEKLSGKPAAEKKHGTKGALTEFLERLIGEGGLGRSGGD